MNKVLKAVKDHFWKWIWGLPAAYLIVILLVIVFVSINSYAGWKCNNYQKVTGLETQYIDYDACYVKGSDKKWIRYDSNYKDVK